MECTSLDRDQIDALRDGDLATAFGSSFEGLHLHDPVTLPGGRMKLVHRVTEIDPNGGRYGIGAITAEADIRADDWFLTCHFVDDKVMPGTLMYECCLHTLRIYLLRMGWVADAADVAYEPVAGVRSRLKCRGQVLDTTRVVRYEVSIKEYGYGPEPFAIVDALMYADDKAVVEINDMSVRLAGLSREQLAATWNAREAQAQPRAIYDRESILAFSTGKPSQAFGLPYQVFDEQRTIARLPRPPFQFLDRVTDVRGTPFEMKAGASCVAEFDVTADAWYFAENRQRRMPYAILLEAVLQPCGWLAAYVGSALTSEENLKFRNLGGEAVQSEEVFAGDDTLSTSARLTDVSSSGGMIIQHYTYRMTNRADRVVYEGTTYFGFFSARALAEQIGIREARPFEPGTPIPGHTQQFEAPRTAPFAADKLRMVETIDRYEPDGGPHGLGLILGSIGVDPSMWFFKAHFYQDPVWPGSLGLEAFQQLLKVVAVKRWGLGPDAEFSTMPLGARHRWIYRGQIIPSNSTMQVQACVTAVEDDRRRLTAEGFVSVDGVPIYQLHDFALEAH
jgi:3-hydroxymyristoyl/3-hydroxydecanoyl-(acyl carrier protein) dehydratase